MSDALQAALRARGVEFSRSADGDIFFERPDDRPTRFREHRPPERMYIRVYPDGSYAWSQNGSRYDINLIDIRPAEVTRRHSLAEVLQRVDDFLGLVVAGRLVIDTLGVAREAMKQGIGHENAERIAEVTRNIVLGMHESGMDAEEIRCRFDEICEQLRRERRGIGDQEDRHPA